MKISRRHPKVKAAPWPPFTRKVAFGTVRPQGTRHRNLCIRTVPLPPYRRSDEDEAPVGHAVRGRQRGSVLRIKTALDDLRRFKVRSATRSSRSAGAKQGLTGCNFGAGHGSLVRRTVLANGTRPG